VFTGVNQNPAGGAKKGGLLGNLTGLPFKFNILVRAPFRGLTNSASAFVNPQSLLGGAARPATPPVPVQPPLSENR
jgi:translocation and assembly module TamB